MKTLDDFRKNLDAFRKIWTLFGKSRRFSENLDAFLKDSKIERLKNNGFDRTISSTMEWFQVDKYDRLTPAWSICATDVEREGWRKT